MAYSLAPLPQHSSQRLHLQLGSAHKFTSLSPPTALLHNHHPTFTPPPPSTASACLDDSLYSPDSVSGLALIQYKTLLLPSPAFPSHHTISSTSLIQALELTTFKSSLLHNNCRLKTRLRPNQNLHKSLLLVIG